MRLYPSSLQCQHAKRHMTQMQSVQTEFNDNQCN
ncbi:hypothetical protein A8990_101330 [Paenibacillus taihuensis]|uniref:Uncharacterized protein n=1 Tax=Paenibacillus taihuensis TaxID=1156355 RepID=A0A3D9SPP1_9BACL|nr:hypothetical protein A8990_101330 [Paenibacillus taihuensis]